MARGSFFAGIMKSGALAAALLAGAAVPGYAGDPTKLTLTGSATMTTDYMFRSISNTNQNPARAARIRSDLRHLLVLHLGLQYRFTAKTSSSTTVPASRPNGAHHLHLAGFSGTPIRAMIDDTRLFRGEGRCVLDHRRVDPCHQQLLVAGQFPSVRPVRCNRWNAHLCLPGHRSCGISSRPASAASSDSSRTSRYAERLHLLECGPDSRLPGALVG